MTDNLIKKYYIFKNLYTNNVKILNADDLTYLLKTYKKYNFNYILSNDNLFLYID